jgi:hypothetical protein
MLKDDGLLSSIISRCVHDEVRILPSIWDLQPSANPNSTPIQIQNFIQIEVQDMLRFANAKKRPCVKELMQLRAIAGDYGDGVCIRSLSTKTTYKS